MILSSLQKNFTRLTQPTYGYFSQLSLLKKDNLFSKLCQCDQAETLLLISGDPASSYFQAYSYLLENICTGECIYLSGYEEIL